MSRDDSSGHLDSSSGGSSCESNEDDSDEDSESIVAHKPVVEDHFSEVSEERLIEIDRYIGKWRETNEYKKLCEKVRDSVEEKMREDWMKASKTSRYLSNLAKKAESLWPPE